jgi:hypothetical protein
MAMDLDTVMNAFVNVQTIIICLSIYLMTYVIRKVVEGVWKGAKTNRIWREVWLPIGPIVNGGLVGVMAKTFVWPTVVDTSLSGRIMYGAICGVFSALLYSRVRSFIQSTPAQSKGHGGLLKPVNPHDPPPADEDTSDSDPPPADDLTPETPPPPDEKR